MVVLEGGGMLTSNGNQYLQPDYLSPLPTTLDAKKSPLALLAQTCSQIGADSPSTKPLISTLDKPKKSSSAAAPANMSGDNLPRTSPAVGGHKPENIKRSTPDNKTVAFKPYENNVTKKSSDDVNVRPSSKVNNSCDSAINSDDKKTPCSTKSASPSATNTGTPLPETGKSTPANTTTNDRKSTSPTTSTSSSTARGASPIIRSGLEILQGHPKDLPLGASYKPGAGLPSALASTGLGGHLSSLCCPPGLEHAANPAFRPPFAGGPFSHHHAAAAAAMLAASGYPPSATATPGSPYVSYARVKTPSGGEALVPVCKDPYCTGCQFSMHNQQLLMGAAAAAAGTGPCPSGCTQCDHQKYGLAAMAMSSLVPPPGPLPPPSSLGYPQLGSPYVCNWIAGESYCGKRFRTSEELLQHLRTHTASTGSDSAANVSSSGTASGGVASNPLLNPLFSTTAALHRAAAAAAAAGYPNPPLSPLSAARYHPYAKPGLPSTLGASPYSAFNPTPLSPYYSPYSLYGQRLGAAVHP